MTKIAIVGRPNVGKSALFNRICKERIAIVDEAEGVTRDRLYSDAECFGFPFQAIDTGGIDPRSKADFNDLVKKQAEIAIEEADSIIMVVDAQVGITALDQEVAQILLRKNKPVCLAVNKVDDRRHENLLYPFYGLGISKLVAVSAAQNRNIAELLETATEPLIQQKTLSTESGHPKVAIIGRPNVGKSTLTNYLLNDNRCIVSPIAGTTRDSVDIDYTVDGSSYTLIDTAGIRRKKGEKEAVDKFAFIRTERAIERADVCLLMLDAQTGLTAQEKRIAKEIERSGKGCVILFNKWDLVKGFRMEHCLKQIEDEVPFLKHCEKIMISAKSGRNVEKIFPAVNQVMEASEKRITTGELNRFMAGAIQRLHPPMITGKRLRIYYLSQVETKPPRFVLFVNYPDLMTDSYQRYLYNRFREAYAFPGTPLVFHLRKHRQSRAAR